MIPSLSPYPSMKDSDIDWLGSIPSHWDVRKLRHLLSGATERNRPDLPLLSVVRRKGVIVRDVDSKEKNHNYIPSDLSNYKVVRVGQFAMNKMKAWQGSFGVSRYEGIVSPAYYVFDLEGVEGSFFNVAIRSNAYRTFFSSASDGVRIGQWDLSRDRMKEIPFFIPPTEEQDAIVRFLDHADRRIRRYIRAKKKQIRLLEEQKQALIHRAVTRGLDPDVPLKPSGVEWLDEIPEHWADLRLGVASSLIQTGPFGSQLQASEYVVAGIPVINPSHLKNGGIQESSDTSVDRAKAEELSRHRFRPGDIVAARRGELGRCALVTERESGWLCGTGSLMIRVKETIFFPRYLLALLSSHGVGEALDLASIGATMSNINAGIVSSLRLPCPPLDEQKRIIDQIDELKIANRRAAASLTEEIELLQEYRTRLIADVVTGKLDVREAAKNLPEEPEEDEESEDLEEAGEEFEGREEEE